MIFGFFYLLIPVSYSYAQVFTTDKSYIVKRIALESGHTSTLAGLSGAQAQVGVRYLDRFGRPTVEIGLSTSPGNKDIIQGHVFDIYGMETKRLLPYTDGSGNGLYRSNVITEQQNFYNSQAKVGHDAAPWYETDVERSPLKRIDARGGLGSDYQLTGNHHLEYKYDFNTLSDKVLKWKIANESLYLSSELYFGDHCINKNTTYLAEYTSGNDHTVVNFYDDLGQKLLSRTFNGDDTLDTYYVYNGHGNVEFIIPPKASKIVRTSGIAVAQSDHLFVNSQLFPWYLERDEAYRYVPGARITLNVPSINIEGEEPITKVVFTGGFRLSPMDETSTLPVTSNDSDLGKLVFINQYDERQRLISRKVPGSKAIYYLYDDLGRLIMSQDGNQREKNEWTFTKYDGRGRPVISGVWSSPASLEQMRDSIRTELTLQKGLYEIPEIETPSGSEVRHGYSNTVFPIVNDDSDYLMVSYYDNYDFYASWSDKSNFQANTANGINNTVPLSYPKGIETGGKVRILGTNTWLRGAKYYDRELKFIQGVSEHHMGHLEKIYLEYDWQGKVIRSRLDHEVSGSQTVNITQRYEYDNSGRVLKEYHQMDSNAEVEIASFSYNELGQLVDKKIHKKPDNSYVQSVDYRYNIYGALTHINQSSRAPYADDTGDPTDQFGMELYYNTSPSGLTFTNHYNGLISGATWGQTGMSGATERSYQYEYDPLSRLSSATYKEKNTGDWTVRPNHFNVSNLTYDLNGNIETLQRNRSNTGAVDAVDDLTYEYDGNQLVRLDDTEDADEGFVDGANNTIEYTYDANGNMISDDNRLIKSITYNLLNKPEKITLVSDDSIRYTYDAAGSRLSQKVFVNGALVHKKEYVGSMVFEDNALAVIHMPQGRIKVSGSPGSYSYAYEYVLIDHLGNTRVTLDTNGNVLQSNDYYPFGLPMEHEGDVVTGTNQPNEYLYQGKEWQTQLALNIYDFHARQYDPSTGRMIGADPANQYVSPYIGMGNNPVMMIDPDGRVSVWSTIEDMFEKNTGGSSTDFIHGPLTDYYIAQQIAFWSIGIMMATGIPITVGVTWSPDNGFSFSASGSIDFRKQDNKPLYTDYGSGDLEILVGDIMLPGITIESARMGIFPEWWGKMDGLFNQNGGVEKISMLKSSDQQVIDQLVLAIDFSRIDDKDSFVLSDYFYDMDPNEIAYKFNGLTGGSTRELNGEIKGNGFTVKAKIILVMYKGSADTPIANIPSYGPDQSVNNKGVYRTKWQFGRVLDDGSVIRGHSMGLSILSRDDSKFFNNWLWGK